MKNVSSKDLDKIKINYDDTTIFTNKIKKTFQENLDNYKKHLNKVQK